MELTASIVTTSIYGAAALQMYVFILKTQEAQRDMIGRALATVAHCEAPQAKVLKAVEHITRLSDLDDASFKFPVLIGVNGIIKTDSPVISGLSGVNAVICKEEVHFCFEHEEKPTKRDQQGTARVVTTRTRQYALDYAKETEWWVDDRSGTRLWIRDGMHAKGSIAMLDLAYDIHHTDPGPLLMTTGVRLEDPEQGQVEKLSDRVLGKRFLGTKRIEHTLPVDTKVLVIGEVSKLADGRYVLQAPKNKIGFLIIRDVSFSTIAKECQNIEHEVLDAQTNALGINSIALANIGLAAEAGFKFVLKRKGLSQGLKILGVTGIAAVGGLASIGATALVCFGFRKFNRRRRSQTPPSPTAGTN